MLACTVWCTVMCTDVTWHVWCVQPSVLRDTCDVYRCNVTCVMCTFDVWCVHPLVSRDTCDVYSVSHDTFATCQCARRHHCAPIGCVVGVTIQYTLSTISTISRISRISTHPFCLPRHPPPCRPEHETGHHELHLWWSIFHHLHQESNFKRNNKKYRKMKYVIDSSSHTHGKSLAV